MKPLRFPRLHLALAVSLLVPALQSLAQTPPRVPQGRHPERGAALPEATSQLSATLALERDAERVFAWLGPFEPMLKPAQLESFRLSIRERLGPMRQLEDRRRTLALEVLQTAVTAGAKPEKVREKAVALGQAVTELGLQQAEMLRAIQPPLSAQQRGELRLALARMFEEGVEPLSFTTDSARTEPRVEVPSASGIWLPTSGAGPASGAPNPRQPPSAPRAPEPR